MGRHPTKVPYKTSMVIGGNRTISFILNKPHLGNIKAKLRFTLTKNGRIVRHIEYVKHLKTRKQRKIFNVRNNRVFNIPLNVKNNVWKQPLRNWRNNRR